MFLLKGSYENGFCGIRKMFLKKFKNHAMWLHGVKPSLKNKQKLSFYNCSNHLKILFNDIILPKTI